MDAFSYPVKYSFKLSYFYLNLKFCILLCFIRASKRAEKEREQERFLVNDEPISHSHNNHNKEMMHMNRQMKPNDSGQGRRENFVPDFLLKRSMTDAQPLNNNRLAVSTAIKALRFAMRHPLTNYSEVCTNKGYIVKV